MIVIYNYFCKTFGQICLLINHIADACNYPTEHSKLLLLSDCESITKHVWNDIELYTHTFAHNIFLFLYHWLILSCLSEYPVLETTSCIRFLDTHSFVCIMYSTFRYWECPFLLRTNVNHQNQYLFSILHNQHFPFTFSDNYYLLLLFFHLNIFAKLYTCVQKYCLSLDSFIVHVLSHIPFKCLYWLSPFDNKTLRRHVNVLPLEYELIFHVVHTFVFYSDLWFKP